MSNMKKSALAAVLILALLLMGCTAASAVEIPEPAIAICYLEDLQNCAYLEGLTVPPLYEVEDGRISEGILSIPEDVTAEYAGEARYGIPDDTMRCYAFRVRMQQDLFWEDGKAVMVEDLVTAVLDRLEEFSWIANANAYLAGYEQSAEEIMTLKEAGFDSVSEARESGYGRFYIDLANFWGLEESWKSVEDCQRVIDYAMTPGLDERYVTPAYLYQNYLAEGMALSYFQSEYIGVAAHRKGLTTEDVGLLKTGELEMVIITAEPITAQTLAARLAELELVRNDFEGCYGPYRVTDEGADEIRLERNPYWQGEVYPADVIRCLGR